MKPREPQPLKEILDPKPVPREKMVELVPPPAAVPDWEEVRPEDSVGGVVPRWRIRAPDQGPSTASWSKTAVIAVLVLAYVIYSLWR